ncbi:hypothetical protein C1645_822640 [Glomus cerebriforme]|uniref:Uncharacterized protein n=1 Tax=Glomus cerebriforme TaxID=658196 RepID=A0A397SYC1_9GLOM|nr:hypothetical protein C1645_822640 [Glomus cerebriforme]
MARSDKKNCKCICCRKTFSTLQKLCQHYKSNKNQCSLPLENNTQRNSQLVIQTPVLETEFQKEASVLGLDYITEEEAKNWISLNARKLENLHECQTLYHDLEQYDPEANCLPILKELKKYQESDAIQPLTLKELKIAFFSQDDEDQVGEAGSGLAIQVYKEGQKKEVVLISEAFIQVENIHFEECPVRRDLERPYKNQSLMNKWIGEVSHPEDNPTYAFNIPIFNMVRYREILYIP